MTRGVEEDKPFGVSTGLVLGGISLLALLSGLTFTLYTYCMYRIKRTSQVLNNNFQMYEFDQSIDVDQDTSV